MQSLDRDFSLIEQSIARGIEFLQRHQLDYGEFSTYIGSEAELKESPVAFDSSCFVTSLITHSLSYVSHPAVDGMVSRASDFLVSEMEGAGLWRYYSSRNFKRTRVSPDLDDTSCVSYVLRRCGRDIPPNEKTFLTHQNKQGVFLVWIMRRPRLLLRNPALYLALRAIEKTANAVKPPMPEEQRGNPRFCEEVDWVPPEEIDPAVNANVILYLGENDSTAAAIRYIVELIESGKEGDVYSYYSSPLAIYYMVSRAHLHSSPSLGEAGPTIVERLAELQCEDGSFGVALLTGVAASTLLTFAPGNPALDAAIQNIVDSQARDGSWPRHAFYNGPVEHWGSAELTTGFCLEALARYKDAHAAKGN
jgi:hypothetical protein